MSAAVGTGNGEETLCNYSAPEITRLPQMWHMGNELFKLAGLIPEDIGAAQLDDLFAPLVPLQLEELGFCGRGEGAAFCEGGDNIRVDGILPLNTSGGYLGEGNTRGTNHLLEAVNQIRGTSVNQVNDAELTGSQRLADTNLFLSLLGCKCGQPKQAQT